jgi:hypothetical protein
MDIVSSTDLGSRREDVKKAMESIESTDSSGFKYGIPRAHSCTTCKQGPIEGPTSDTSEVRFAVRESAKLSCSLVRSK